MIKLFLLFSLIFLFGCGNSVELLEVDKVPSFSGKILLPNKTSLKTGRVILMPLNKKIKDIKRVEQDLDKQGKFEFNSDLFATKYKVLVYVHGGYKRYVPEKYFICEDEDSDLIVDLSSENTAILKMNTE